MCNFFRYYSAYIRIISGKKLLNIIRTGADYALSRITGKVIHRGKVYSIAIEPCNICQLHCPECPSGNSTLTRAKGMIDEHLFCRIIHTAAPYLVNLTLYFQGEPFIHPQATRLIRYAADHNIYVNTSTNAQSITADMARDIVRSGLHRIIISMDGHNQHTYEQYRIGGSLEHTLQAISWLQAAKKELNSTIPHIEVQCLVLSTTEMHMDAIKHTALQAGADSVTFKSAQFYNTTSPLMPTLTGKLNRYTTNNWGEHIRKPSHNVSCYRAWNSVVITWDGQVLPCCYDKDARLAYAAWSEKWWKDMNHDEKYKQFLHKVLTNKKSIPMCQNCYQ